MEEDRPQNASAPFDWTRDTPEAQGLDSRALIRALRRIEDDGVKLHGLILLRGGRTLLELYRPPYDKDALHNLKSVTKSVLSALVGIALDEGILDSLDRSALDYFPEYATGDLDPRKREIKLRHLLTMTSGLDLDENGPIMERIFAGDDWVQATFARPMTTEPGERFLYSTPLSHVLSVVLSRASGESLLALGRRALFGPLGIERVQWARDPKGYCLGGSELFMTPRDMAKIGLLYLNRGRWGSAQVLPADWVRDSTRDHMAGEGYGHGWWRTPLDAAGYKAAGWAGQRIFVLPRWNLVAVATAGDAEAFDKLFGDFDTAAIAEGPLPPNPEAAQELEALVTELERPAPRPLAALPPLAAEISGRTYRLEPAEDPAPFQEIAFDFTRPEGAAITLGTEEGLQRLALGLDGLFRTTATGRFGRMPEGNRIALKGRWTGPRRLEIDYRDLGDPNHVRLTLDFSGDRIAIAVELEPVGLRFSLTGATAPAPGPRRPPSRA